MDNEMSGRGGMDAANFFLDMIFLGPFMRNFAPEP